MTFLAYLLVGVFMALKSIASGFAISEERSDWILFIAFAVIDIIAWPLELVYLIGLAIYLRTRKPPQRVDLVIVDRT